METEAERNWEGTVSAKIPGCSADKIWPLLEDFFNFHVWVPTIDACYGIEGISGQPGCIRYNAKTSSEDGSEQTVTKWAHEKLLSIDPIEKCLSYEIMENNVGFNPLVATMRLMPLECPEGHGCQINWSFSAKPMEKWNLADLISLYSSAISIMAKRMEDAILHVGGSSPPNNEDEAELTKRVLSL